MPLSLPTGQRCSVCRSPSALIPPNSPAQPQTAGTLTLLPVALRAPVTAGQLAVENGHYVVETLARACDGCLNGEFAALITGPVHKGVINDAGIPFLPVIPSFSKSVRRRKKVVMMLATEELRVALATTHLPLRDIADAITPCTFARSDCYFCITICGPNLVLPNRAFWSAG